MKRLHTTPVIIAVLLFAASAMPTSVFATGYDTEQRVLYYENGVQVGGAVYSSCVGWNRSWGQQSGEFKLEKAVKCADGSAIYCHWYRWTGSAWEFVLGSDCDSSGGEGPPPDHRVMNVLPRRQLFEVRGPIHTTSANVTDFFFTEAPPASSPSAASAT